MEISKPSFIFFSIILFNGMLTTFTDLKSRKIYNKHLATAALLGLMVTAYAFIVRHDHVLFHCVNGLIAFLVGWLMHRFDLWKGGDAKLFTLYAFLMPATLPGRVALPDVINLFACSFLVGTIILVPIFIKDIIINHSTIADKLFLPSWRSALFQSIVKIFMWTWISFPFYFLAGTINPVIIFTLIYSSLFIRDLGKAKQISNKEALQKKSLQLLLGFILGFLMRLMLSPASLSPLALTHYILMVLMSVTLSILIQTILNVLKNYHERIPFAPLLFMGCALCYTPFLTWIINLLQFMRR